MPLPAVLSIAFDQVTGFQSSSSYVNSTPGRSMRYSHHYSGSRGDAPDRRLVFSAGVVDELHPVHRPADPAAGPVEGRHAHVPGPLLPLAVCKTHGCCSGQTSSYARREIDMFVARRTDLVAWRSTCSGRRRAPPPARSATRPRRRPRSRTCAGSA